jgi:hypothetical protein
MHTESDLRSFLRWSADQPLDPLEAARTDIERYVRWLQDVRCYQPSTVSRRLSAVIGFYRVCVIDQNLPHPPADYIADLGEEHGHRVMKVRGKGGKVVLVPLPPAVARAIDSAVEAATTARPYATPAAPAWTGTQQPAGSSTSPRPRNP